MRFPAPRFVICKILLRAFVSASSDSRIIIHLFLDDVSFVCVLFIIHALRVKDYITEVANIELCELFGTTTSNSDVMLKSNEIKVLFFSVMLTQGCVECNSNLK